MGEIKGDILGNPGQEKAKAKAIKEARRSDEKNKKSESKGGTSV